MERKNNNVNAFAKSFQAIVPLLTYFVVTTLAMNIIAAVTMSMGGKIEKWYMMLQTVVSLITFPFIYYYYKKDKQQPTVFHLHLKEIMQQKSKRQKTGNGILMFLTGAITGIAMNNMIQLTTLTEKSAAYQEVTKSFFAGDIVFELLGSCFVIPILEEMLYRGVLYGRLCDFMILEAGTDYKQEKRQQKKYRFYAILCTSLIFGAMHMNIVQFIYAAVLGIMLSWFVEKSGHLYGAVAAHIGANLMSVLRMETAWFQWMINSTSIFMGVTLLCLVLSAVLFWILWKCNREV